MTNQRLAQKKPNPQFNPPIYPKSEQYQKQLADDPTKLFSFNKLFIAPNRDSKPLTSPINKGFTELPTQQRFQPSFDNFSLSNMFANKTMDEEEVAEFKKENPSDLQNYTTPIRKQNEHNICFIRTSERQEGKNVQELKKSRPKEKGLRKLSQRAYEIVLNMHSASYKEVANKLVDELNNQKEIDQEVIKEQFKGKDEQNIKRRVYDALNVLIALGVLRKEGRKIVGDRSLSIESELVDMETLRKEIVEREMRIKKKKERVEFQKTKRDITQKLLQQNINRQKVQLEIQKIKIPFLVLRGQKKIFEEVKLDQDFHCKQIQLRTSNTPNQHPTMDLDFYTQYSLSLRN